MFPTAEEVDRVLLEDLETSDGVQMSYRDEMYAANQAAGHRYNCGYAAGADCEPPCPMAHNYDYNQQASGEVPDDHPCCDNPECSGYPDPKCDGFKDTNETAGEAEYEDDIPF